jgi:hypothetical protein
MKKKLLAVLLLASLGTGQLSAQQKDSLTVLPTVTVTSTTVVTAAVDKAFEKTFPDAENLRWYKLNKNYLAKFIQKDMKHQTLFAKNGYLKYDISYGTAENLTEDMRKKVLGAYMEYEITHVANVKEAGRNIWVINLENMKHLVLVRIEEDEMEEVEKYNKSK